MTLFLCPECDAPFLTMQVPDGSRWGDPELAWPKEENRRLHPAIPVDIRGQLEEAEEHLRAGWSKAAAVAVRRGLEAVCRRNGVSGGKKNPLAAQLRELRDLGVIDGRLWEWADHLRDFLNGGAHYDGHAIKGQDVRDALTLAEAILDRVYVFPAQEAELDAKYAQFKARLPKGQGGGTSQS
ncbi:DUF4145 domain-containing protein [Nonomuraea sp. NPDC048882]|uniref:DUF4145 domain-containing protein n=1 Tax=Nonomuraea sp. NPDC048882 TaxID=3154347 RepID=UPI00340AA794